MVQLSCLVGAQEIVSLSPGEDPRRPVTQRWRGEEAGAGEEQNSQGPGKCRRRGRLFERECVQGSGHL